MLCLEVEIDGRRVCRAGPGEYGMVSFYVVRQKYPPGWERRTGVENLRYGVHGMAFAPAPPDYDNVSWANGDLHGDEEVRLRWVEAPSSDEPISREPAEPLTSPEDLAMTRRTLARCLRDLEKLKTPAAKDLARKLRPVISPQRGRKAATASTRSRR
jgi:hypothetical protein